MAAADVHENRSPIENTCETAAGIVCLSELLDGADLEKDIPFHSEKLEIRQVGRSSLEEESRNCRYRAVAQILDDQEQANAKLRARLAEIEELL